MNKKQAINMAIKAMKNEMQKIAFDANLYDAGAKSFILGERRSKEKQQWQEAIRVLEELK